MNICVLGHGIGLEKAREGLAREGHRLVGIVTHPRAQHTRDAQVHQALEARGLYLSVFDWAARAEIPLLETPDANREDAIEWIVARRPDALISIGSRHLLRRALLERYPGRVLNVHTAPLPQYRGGANDSWMILNGLREASGVCHLVTEAIDAGPIVSRRDYRIAERAWPIDLMASRMAIIPDLVAEALARLQDPSFEPQPQEPSAATYFPRLQASVDGWIDWSQPAWAIERHVRAFGTPYAGAFADLEPPTGRRMWILDGNVERLAEPLHPHALGLVIGVDGRGGIKVATGEQLYVITRLKTEDGASIVPERAVRLGRRFRLSRMDSIPNELAVIA